MKAISKRSVVALGVTLALLLGVSALLVYGAGWRSVLTQPARSVRCGLQPQR